MSICPRQIVREYSKFTTMHSLAERTSCYASMNVTESRGGFFTLFSPRPTYLPHFFCVCSLLNKPTAPENGTHHTAAVEKEQQGKRPPPPPRNPPSPSVTWIPDATLVCHANGLQGGAVPFDSEEEWREFLSETYSPCITFILKEDQRGKVL